MKFKALIFDLDGTALPTGKDSKPSAKVIEAVKKAKNYLSVSFATARRLSSVTEIINMLDISSPSIITGGTTIINPRNENIIWQKCLDKQTINLVMGIAKKYPGEILMDDELNCSIIYLRNPNKNITDKILEELKKISNINCVVAISWIKGWTDIHVTHIDATKRNAVEELLKILKVKKEETIVVGDSFNDLPFFEAGGFKIAMGNAVEELKDKADFIAPSVDDDGLAFVIEKFIIKK